MHFSALFTTFLAISITGATPTALLNSEDLVRTSPPQRRDVSSCPAQWKSHVGELNALKVDSGDAFESFCKSPSAETAQPLCAYMSHKEERSVLGDVLDIVRGVLNKLLGTNFYADKCEGAQRVVKKDELSDHVLKCLSLFDLSILIRKQMAACSGDFDAAGSAFVDSLDAYCKKSDDFTKKELCKALLDVTRLHVGIDLSAVITICGGHSGLSGGGKRALNGGKATLGGQQRLATA